MSRDRYRAGHALTALDASQETCLAVCECGWVAFRSGAERRSEAAYGHAIHAHEAHLDALADGNEGRHSGRIPKAPARSDYTEQRRYYPRAAGA